MSRDHPAEYYAEKLKHRKYDAGFVGINFDFSALVLNQLGAESRLKAGNMPATGC